nr:ATP-dependent DNA helicase PIF1-like [Tanacetum cinerariifolium]
MVIKVAIFVYGYGGTEKKYLYKTLSAALRSKGEIVLNVASNGITVLLLEGGRTTHSRCAIPINVVDDSMCHISADSELVELIRMTKLIIWDEAPMTHKHCYEAFDRTLRDICQTDPTTPNDKLFGENVVLFGGDWILSIGNGTIGGKNDEETTIEFLEDILISDSSDNIGSLIKETYPQLIQNLYNPTFFQEKSILAPTHTLVDMINDQMLELIPGDEKTYESSDSVGIIHMDTNFNESLYTSDFLNSIKVAGLPQHSLKLKIRAPVMCMRNIDQRAGLCNGIRLQIQRIRTNITEAKIISGGNVRSICAIPCMVLSPSDTKMPFKLSQRQFHVALCFAMTLNKCQGQTLTQVGLFLQRPVLSYEQLYVDVSRVKSKKGLKILCCDEDGNYAQSTTNVVYKEFLFQI